jgi:hypothetical protein
MTRGCLLCPLSRRRMHTARHPKRSGCRARGERAAQPLRCSDDSRTKRTRHDDNQSRGGAQTCARTRLRRPRGVEDYASDREPPERRGGGGGRPAPHGWPFGRAARLCRLLQHRRTAAQATDCAAPRSGAQAYTGDAMVLGDAARLRALVTRHRLSSEQPHRSGTPSSAMLAPRVPPSPSPHESMGVAATVAYKQLTAPCPSQPQGDAVWQASPCAPAPACPLVAGMPGGVRGRGLMRRIAWPRSGTTAPSATARPRALVVSRSDPTVSMPGSALLSPSRPCPAPPNLGGGYQVALGLRESSHKSRVVDRGPRRSNEPRTYIRPLPSAVPTGAMRRSSRAARCIRCAAVSSWMSAGHLAAGPCW